MDMDQQFKIAFSLACEAGHKWAIRLIEHTLETKASSPKDLEEAQTALDQNPLHQNLLPKERDPLISQSKDGDVQWAIFPDGRLEIKIGDELRWAKCSLSKYTSGTTSYASKCDDKGILIQRLVHIVNRTVRSSIGDLVRVMKIKTQHLFFDHGVNMAELAYNCLVSGISAAPMVVEPQEACDRIVDGMEEHEAHIEKILDCLERGAEDSSLEDSLAEMVEHARNLAARATLESESFVEAYENAVTGEAFAKAPSSQERLN